MIVLFGITTVMLAGGGTVFEEQLHLSYQTGLLVTLVLSYLVLSRGIGAIMTVNSIVVPIMLLLAWLSSSIRGILRHRETGCRSQRMIPLVKYGSRHFSIPPLIWLWHKPF